MQNSAEEQKRLMLETSTCERALCSTLSEQQPQTPDLLWASGQLGAFAQQTSGI